MEKPLTINKFFPQKPQINHKNSQQKSINFPPRKNSKLKLLSQGVSNSLNVN
jgi:hypothetical protein